MAAEMGTVPPSPRSPKIISGQETLSNRLKGNKLPLPVISKAWKYSPLPSAAGGQVLTPKMPIPAIGWFAAYKDSEGNTFGIMQNDPKTY
jgi:hypothetical protein